MPGESKLNEEKRTVALMEDDSPGLTQVDEKAHFAASIENLKAAKEARLNNNRTLAISIAKRIIKENSYVANDDHQKRSLMALTNIFLAKAYYEQKEFGLASEHYSTHLFFMEPEFWRQYRQLEDTILAGDTPRYFRLNPTENYKLWKYCFENGYNQRLIEISGFINTVENLPNLTRNKIIISDVQYGVGFAKKALYHESGNIMQAKAALADFFNAMRNYFPSEQGKHNVLDCEQQIIEIFASAPYFSSYLESKKAELKYNANNNFISFKDPANFKLVNFRELENLIHDYYASALCHKLLGDVKMAFNDYKHAAELAYTCSSIAESKSYLFDFYGQYYTYDYWIMFSKHCEKYLNILVHNLKQENKDIYNFTRVAPRVAFTRVNHDSLLKYSVLPLKPTIVDFANAAQLNQIDSRFLKIRPNYVEDKIEITPNVFPDSPGRAEAMLSISWQEFQMVEAERIKTLNVAVTAFVNGDLLGVIKIMGDLITEINAKKSANLIRKASVTESVVFSTAMIELFARQILSRTYFLQGKLDQAAYECAEYVSLHQVCAIKNSVTEYNNHIFGDNADNIAHFTWTDHELYKLANHCLMAGCYNQALKLLELYCAISRNTKADLKSTIIYQEGLCYKGLYFLSHDYSNAHKALDRFFSLIFNQISECPRSLAFIVETEITEIIKSNEILTNYLRTKITDLTVYIKSFDNGTGHVNLEVRLTFLSKLCARALCHKLLGNFKEANSDYTRTSELTLIEIEKISGSEKSHTHASLEMKEDLQLLVQHCQQSRVAAIRGLKQDKSDVHNWSRISVVTAFARANNDSAIRDSVLALIPTITQLAGSDRYAADELQLVQKLTTLTPK